MSIVRNVARNLPAPRPRVEVVQTRPRPVLLNKDALLERAIRVARDPRLLAEQPPVAREQISQIIKALSVGSGGTVSKSGPRRLPTQGALPVSASVLAARAHQALGPSSNITPVDIAVALQAQGLNMVEPFSPGAPLQPYYGYNRRPRQYDYPISTNTTTQTREDRIPFKTLLQLWRSYDIAQTCTRYSINDLRSMRIRFEAMDGYEENPTKEIAEAKRRLRRPDGKRLFPNWLAQNQRNLWIFDSAPIYRMRDKAGRVTGLKNFSAMTLAPMLDYYGDIPDSPAPAFVQFIEGVPWDWLTWDDVIYEPFWPETDSPYGTPPLETVMVNANTDMRLQLFFLQFFTAGQVPEAFAIAPEDMTSGDDVADFEEQYYDYFHGDQTQRWGLHWLPNGTELEFYKPQIFDPDLAEYVERRTISAFGLTPQNLGILADVNRASSETQVDQQFRITTLPVVGYYEGILDSVMQDDWDIPVQIRFDTGREKEDRLMEAQAHEIYWSMGAESPDEVREKVLGLPVNTEERVPRAIYDPRLGVIPLSHVSAISGDVDPLTMAPRPGTVERIPYVLPGTPGANPDQDNGQGGPNVNPPDPTAATSGTQYDDAQTSDRRRGAGTGGARPKGPASTRRSVAPQGPAKTSRTWDPSKTYPTPLYPPPSSGASKELMPGESNGAKQPFPGGLESDSPTPEDWPGYGRWPGGSTAQGTGVPPVVNGGSADDAYDAKRTTYALKEGGAGGAGGAGAGGGAGTGGATAGITASSGIAGMDGGSSQDDEDERDDLRRWQRNARKAVARGSFPRPFADAAIRPAMVERVWSQLQGATTRDEVDAAFKSAKPVPPKKAGIALVARDSGRVLLVQRVDDDDE